MTFATYSRGYKGLAYDLTSTLTTRTPVATGPLAGRPLADAIAANQPVPPETVDSYEVGFKSSFFDDRLIWNVTAFYMIFEGFQAQSRDQVLNQNLLNSIGKVTSRGVETEVAARFGRPHAQRRRRLQPRHHGGLPERRLLSAPNGGAKAASATCRICRASRCSTRRSGTSTSTGSTTSR